MESWLIVLIVLWSPLVCLASVLTGAYIMWCRSRGANPLNDVKMFVNRDDGTAWNPRVSARDEETPGFFD